MLIEKIHESIRYTLSNEGLAMGDKVYPIGNGRVRDDGSWILHELDFTDFTSGFPDEPHTIENLNYSDYKPCEVRTDHGFSPIESYFKVIKKEQQVTVDRGGLNFAFVETKWVEI